MADATRFEFTNKDILELMIKKQDLHKGHWVLQAKFNFAAMNISSQNDGSDATPAGVVGLAGLAIELVPEPLSFSVNAAEVNPEK